MLYPDFDELVALKDCKVDLKFTSQRLVKSSTAGNHRSPFRGQGLEFDSVREYVPGDDIRNIDWRVTARTGSPHLKLFKEDRERHLILCLDMNSGMRFGTRKTFKSVQAARIAALLGWKGVTQQDRVSACLFGDVTGGIHYFAPGRTAQSFCAMLKMLSKPTHEQHSVSLVDALQHLGKVAPAGALIYVISDFLELNPDFQNEAALALLRKRCDVIFISVNDRADASISPIGTIGFCSDQSEKIYVNTEIESGRESYAAQWRENRKSLHGVTSKSKIPLIEMWTESDAARDLMLGLKYIAKRSKR